MLSNLEVIRRVIDEHKTIGGHMKLLGESVTDAEALAALERVHADWIPGRPDVAAAKLDRLRQAVGFVGEGLRNHFAFEEEALPPLLGELLMRAIVLQHREIGKELDEAVSIVADAQLQGLGREELLAEESRIQQRIRAMSRLVEEHGTREELLLDMVQSALEEKG